MEKNILIIENQEFQFKKIYPLLKKGNYHPFPSDNDDEFVKFIDHIRVWVNEEYQPHHRILAYSYLTNFIDKNNINLVLMDYKLGGAHHCLTGIHLAEELNNFRLRNKKEILPVYFLSKTELNDKKREERFNSYKEKFAKTEWIHKGYFGEEILEATYFNRNVLKLIDDFFEKTYPAMEALSSLERFIKKFQYLKNTTAGSSIRKAHNINKLELLYANLAKGNSAERYYDLIQKLISDETKLETKEYSKMLENALNDISQQSLNF